MLLDSEIVIRALEHQNPKHAGNPRTTECRRLWVELLRYRFTRVLIAAPTVAEFRVGQNAPALPLLPAIEYVAFTAAVAEDMATWATPNNLKAVRTKSGNDRTQVKYDALIVACARHHKADCVIAYDEGFAATVKLAGLNCYEPSYFEKSQRTLPHT